MSNEDNVSYETNFNERNKNKIIIPIIIVIALLLIMGLFGGYYFLSSNKKIIITKTINTLYDNYESAYNKQKKINIEKPILIDGSFNLNTNIPELEDLSKEQINFQIGYDNENKNLLGGFSLTEDNNKIIEMIYYLINNQTYLKLDEYDKLIKLNSEEDMLDIDSILYNNNENLNIEDTNYIITELKNALIKSIDTNDFTKSTTKIEINNKETSVNKLTYKLNKENLQKLDENLCKNILQNEKLLEKISEIYNISLEELKSELEETYEVTEDYGEFNIYTSKLTNKLSMIEYTYEDEKIQIYFEDKISKISIIEGFYSIDLDFKTNTDEKLDIDYTINYGVVITGNITINYNEINEDKYEITIDYKINYMNYSLGLTGKINIEANENLFDIDTTNAVDESTIDQNTLTDVMNNLMLKLENSNLYKILNGLSESTNNSLM